VPFLVIHEGGDRSANVARGKLARVAVDGTTGFQATIANPLVHDGFAATIAIVVAVDLVVVLPVVVLPVVRVVGLFLALPKDRKFVKLSGVRCVARVARARCKLFDPFARFGVERGH
jgi:hypothetical protein